MNFIYLLSLALLLNTNTIIRADDETPTGDDEMSITMEDVDNDDADDADDDGDEE